MTGGRKEILTRCFFKNFLHITHTLFCSKSLPCWPCINRNRLIYALSKLPSPYPRDDKNGTLHAIFGLGCVLTGAGISLICVRNALSQQKSFGTAGESSELFIYSMLHVGLPSIRADKGHSGACLDAKRVQHPKKKSGLWTRDKNSHLTRCSEISQTYRGTLRNTHCHVQTHYHCVISSSDFQL